MIARPYLAAAIQLTSTPDLEATLAQAATMVAQAAEAGAKLVGLPENFSQLCASQAEALACIHTTADGGVAWLSATAKQHQIVLFGALGLPAEGGRVRNTLVVMGPDGTELGRYAKRHLFDVDFGGADTLKESDGVEPGDAIVVVDLGDLGKLGLAICYDVRFPEHFRGLVDQGAEILAVPAAFLTHTGKDHWHVLLRARAIENTCYVMAPAQCGRHNDRRASYGHAAVIDPWGTVLGDAGDRPGLSFGLIDPVALAQVRRQLPCLGHRRS